jgi:hypothetical protein
MRRCYSRGRPLAYSRDGPNMPAKAAIFAKAEVDFSKTGIQRASVMLRAWNSFGVARFGLELRFDGEEFRYPRDGYGSRINEIPIWRIASFASTKGRSTRKGSRRWADGPKFDFSSFAFERTRSNFKLHSISACSKVKFTRVVWLLSWRGDFPALRNRHLISDPPIASTSISDLVEFSTLLQR